MIDPVTDDWRTVLGQLHGMIVQVPAGLLIAVVIAEFVAFVQRDHGSRLLRTAMWIITALVAAIVLITGLLASPSLEGELASRHRIIGMALTAVLAAVVIADVALPRRLRILATVVRTSGLGITGGLLVVAGLLGSAAARGPEAVLAATPSPLIRAVAAVLRSEDAPVNAAPLAVAVSAPPLVSAPVPAPVPADLERGVDTLRIDPILDRETFAALFVAAAGGPNGPSTLLVTGRPADPVLASLMPRAGAVRTVRLDDPAIDDATAIAILALTPHVRTVLLHETAVTDALVPILHELGQLEWLSVWGTELDTPALRRRLERDRPGLRVIGDAPLAVSPFGADRG